MIDEVATRFALAIVSHVRLTHAHVKMTTQLHKASMTHSHVHGGGNDRTCHHIWHIGNCRSTESIAAVRRQQQTNEAKVAVHRSNDEGAATTQHTRQALYECRHHLTVKHDGCHITGASVIFSFTYIWQVTIIKLSLCC